MEFLLEIIFKFLLYNKKGTGPVIFGLATLFRLLLIVFSGFVASLIIWTDFLDWPDILFPLAGWAFLLLFLYLQWRSTKNFLAGRPKKEKEVPPTDSPFF